MDGKAVADRLTNTCEAEQREQREAMERSLTRDEERIEVLDKMVMRLYEDMIAGRISEQNFNTMLEKTQTEQTELKAKVSEGRKRLSDEAQLANEMCIRDRNTDISNLNGGKIWSEQDIVSMFSLVQETDWEYIDCVLIPDHASDRVGAVLFRNDKEQTSNVAFFDADGYFQQYGTYARMSDEPDFQYLGGGAVTFRLETEDGIIYNYTITISIDDSNVNFKAEDDLPK